MKVQMIIKNGKVVSPTFTYPANVVIDEGKILTITNSTELPDAEQVVDADGRYVLPGVIDTHVHFRDPGLTYKEDFTTGSMAAITGGVTTVFDMPNTRPPVSNPKIFLEKKNLLEKRSFAHFAILAVVLPDNIDEIPGLAKAGAAGFKIFIGPTTGDLPSPDDSGLFRAFQVISRTGLRVGIHAENHSLVTHIGESLMRQGRKDPLAHIEARPDFTEVDIIQKVILLSKYAGNKVHICHMSTKQGANLVRQAKLEGLPVSAETCPQYLLLEAKDMERLGTMAKINPPLRSRDHIEGLWAGLRDGGVDNVASDHAPHTKEEKVKDNIWETAAGIIGVETMVPLMLTQVNLQKLSLNEFVRLFSVNPAKLFGLYPRKGSLTPGADADITLVDLNREAIIEAKDLHSKNKFTPFEGWRVKGLPTHTIIRGHLVVRDGEIQDQPRGKIAVPLAHGVI